MCRFVTVLLLGLLLLSATPVPGYAQTENIPEITTRADSLALLVYQALGGPEAWKSLPYLAFTFASESNGTRNPGVRHLWNRMTGDYRLEWENQSGDTTFVVLFNINTREGEAYANGVELNAERTDELLQQAYRRYINDTYWMLAPTKLLDPGVHLEYLPDSSTAETAVIHVTFGDVGLTPGDQYWHYIDRETHRVRKWAYHLQSYADDQPPSYFRWTGYEQFETPKGPIWIATRKEAMDGSFVMLTDRIETPAEVPEEMFTDPTPQL